MTDKEPSNVTLKPSKPYPANPETGEPMTDRARAELEAWKNQPPMLLPVDRSDMIDLGTVPVPALFFEGDATDDELDELVRLARVKAQAAALAVLANSAHNYASRVENGVA